MEAKPELVSCAVDPNALVGCQMKEVGDVGDRGSGPLSEPTPQAIVEKQNILPDDSQGNVTASVSAARECTSVAVEEKQVFVSGVVPPTVLVEHTLSQVCTRLDARSPLPTLPAIVEKQTIQFSEELGPQTAAVSAARKTVPVTVGEKRVFFSGSVAFLAKVCEKIKEVCGNGKGRSHSPADIVEKRTRPLGEELSFETVTVRAARTRVPVVVDRKPDYVRSVARVDVEPMLSYVRSRGRDPCIRKRISQARKKLKPMLSPYFIDFDGSVLGNVREITDVNRSRSKMEGYEFRRGGSR